MSQNRDADENFFRSVLKVKVDFYVDALLI